MSQSGQQNFNPNPNPNPNPHAKCLAPKKRRPGVKPDNNRLSGTDLFGAKDDIFAQSFGAFTLGSQGPAQGGNR